MKQTVRTHISVAAVALLLLAAPALAQLNKKAVVVDLKNADGKVVGTATLTEAQPKGVKLELKVHDQPPGQLSFHVHQKPICEPPEFNSAGLHFDPGGVYYNNPHRGHDGVVAAGNPNSTLTVGPDGKAEGSVVMPNLTLGSDDHSVFSNGGTAIILHADVSKLPIDTPTRTACGVIKRPE
jgi:Cu-Zn family superoxide dismutase